MALVASPAHDWTINALIEMFKMNWFTNEKPLPEIVQIAMATEDDGMNGLIILFKKNGSSKIMMSHGTIIGRLNLHHH